MSKINLEESLKELESRELKVNRIKEKYSPLYLFGKLRNLKISERDAFKMTQHYEDVFYIPLIKLIERKEVGK